VRELISTAERPALQVAGSTETACDENTRSASKVLHDW